MKNTKICSVCKIEQDINSFHKNKNSLDGYKSKCNCIRYLHVVVIVTLK